MARSQTSKETGDEQAEEPRRSRRANKGNNSDRWQEILDSAKHNFVNPESVAGDTATDAGTVLDPNDPLPTTEHYEDDAIRCVCGQTTEVEDDDKTFIQCDSCSVWQHAPCVGLAEDNIPEQYFCERCRPDLHVKLLKELSIARLKRMKKTPAKVDRKRKRGGSKALDSDQDHIPSDQEDEPIPDSPKRERSLSLSDVSIVSEASDEVVVKHRRTSHRASEPHYKSSRKQSTSSNMSKTGRSSTSYNATQHNGPKAYTKIEQFSDATRKAIGTALVKMMENAISVATESEGFSLKGDAAEVARTLGLQIEFDLYKAHFEPTGQPDAYKAKYRQLLFNVKDPKNPSLRKRVLNGTLRPSSLVLMSSADMANPEIKAMTEAVREEGLKQSVLVQESGPRIRRTHKGEEYVEGPETHVEQSGSNLASANRPRTHDESDSHSVHSPDPVRSPEEQRSPVQSPDNSRSERARSNSSFDIKNVWSHIETPTTSESPGAPAAKANESSKAPKLETNDEDLLDMLDEKSKEDPDRHDYSSQAPLWHGKLLMPGVGEADAQGILVGGPSSFSIDWAQILGPQLLLDGRIPKPDASKYLCHQRYSKSKHVFALLLQPEGTSSLKRLYDYFVKKDRYGVLKLGTSRVRDGYVVPLPAGSTLPEFISMLPIHNIALGDGKDLLIVVLVVEKAAPVKSEVPQKETSSAPAAVQPQRTESSAPPPVVPRVIPPEQPVWQQSVQPAYSPPVEHHHTDWQAQPHPETAEEAYLRRVQLSRQPQIPINVPPQIPPQIPLDANAHAVLGAFLRAHPEIATNPQVTSSPQLMSQLLDEFVRSGGLRLN